MTLTTWIILTAVSLLFSALFSGVEIAYITSDRVRVGLDSHDGGLVARLIDRFYRNEDLFISTILVGNNILLVIYGMGAAALLEPWLTAKLGSEAAVLTASTIISTTVILLAGEFLPKTVFKINPNRSLRLASLPIGVFYLVLYPVSAFTTWLGKALMRLCGIHTANPRMGMLTVGELNRALDRAIDEVNPQRAPVETEVKMFHNALDFNTIHLRDCILPRNEIVAVNLETTRDELSALFTKSGRSKIIVYREDIDDIVGYIHVSELFVLDSDWRKHIKPVIFAPEALLANKLMRRLLAEKRSIAVVIDEFGGTAGLVTLEDLIEEIFGDIRDEHDTAKLMAKQVAPGVYEFSGRLEIEELRATYHLDIPEDDEYQTLAGYLLNVTGQIPEQGETVEAGDYLFTVLKRSATRLELIRVEPAPKED